MKRKTEWQSFDPGRWTYRREREGYTGSGNGILRWKLIGDIWRDSVDRVWVWSAAPEADFINLIGGRTKTLKAAKLAVETCIRVFEQPEPKHEPGVRGLGK